MKIALRIPDHSFTAELPEPLCKEIFGQAVTRALTMDLSPGSLEPQEEPAFPPYADAADEAYWQKYVDRSNGNGQDSHDGAPRYKGFLYLRCDVCGEDHGFCSKQELAFYRCKKCGKSTLFSEPLKKVFFTCECGRQYKYWTNLTDRMFDINCINCGMPVTVEYSEKDGCYRGLPAIEK